MATVKQVLEEHFLSFLEENELESLRNQMIRTITKAEYELDDIIDDMIEDAQYSRRGDLEDEMVSLKEQIEELELRDKFFEPNSLEDEFKIQWVKDNWDKIPTI
jgi:hypothetical protein